MSSLNIALESGDMTKFMNVLTHMTRDHGMTSIAQHTGLGRESLYKSMRPTAKPEFGTVLRVLHALGFRVQVNPINNQGSPL